MLILKLKKEVLPRIMKWMTGLRLSRRCINFAFTGLKRNGSQIVSFLLKKFNGHLNFLVQDLSIKIFDKGKKEFTEAAPKPRVDLNNLGFAVNDFIIDTAKAFKANGIEDFRE